MRIIRRVRIAHCKRGPGECEMCRQWDSEEYCLLELSRPGQSLGQTRIMEVQVNGEKSWWEFEVVRRLGSEEEARSYGLEQGIDAVD